MLKNVFFTILMMFLFVSCASSPKTYKDDTPLKAAERLLDESGSNEIFTKTIEKLIDSQIAQTPDIAPYRATLLNFFSKYMSWDSLKPEMAKMYAEMFTVEELNEMADFYRKPVGKKAAQLMPEIAVEANKLGQKRVMEHMAELIQMLADEEKRINSEKNIVPEEQLEESPAKTE